LCDGQKHGMLVAWNGLSCDVEWMYRITHILYPSTCSMPRWCHFFWDPLSTIHKQHSCSLHVGKDPVLAQKGYGLEAVYCHVMGVGYLPGAHDSLVDARAQYDVMTKAGMLKYRGIMTNGAALLSTVMTNKIKRDAGTKSEPTRKLPEGWDDDFKGTPNLPASMQYDGRVAGPTMEARHCNSLIDLFHLFMPWSILEYIAQEVNRYANEEWVCPVGIGSGTRQRPLLRPCPPTHQHAPNVRRKRYRSAKRPWQNVTAGAVQCYFGIQIFLQAEGIRYPWKAWSKRDSE